MKTTLCFLLTIGTLVFVHNSVPQEVKLIYFLPNDLQAQEDIDATLDSLIKTAQQEFQNTMENHGFGQKTFSFEADSEGNAIVTHVTGQHSNAVYQNNPFQCSTEVNNQYDTNTNVYYVFLDRQSGSTSGGFGGYHNNGAGGLAVVYATDTESTVHELGHAFGLWHDTRNTDMVSSFCSAQLLSVSRYFGGSGTSSGSTTTNMLTPLRSLPDSIKIQFSMVDTDGLHQAQLLLSPGEGVIDCEELSGNSDTVEFIITNAVANRVNNYGSVNLYVSDDTGYFTYQNFTIDLTDLLEPPEVISIPDSNLATLIRQNIGLASGSSITSNDMLKLISFSPSADTTITDLTGLEYALNLAIFRPNSIDISDLSPLSGLTNLSGLSLRSSQINDVSPLKNLTKLWQLALDVNKISDITPLTNLTNLTDLSLSGNQIKNIDTLRNFTKLETLIIFHNQISNISALSGLTNLRELYLGSNQISDVSPLANLANLEILELSGNRIQDRTPLATLQSKNPSLIINIEPVTIVNQSPEFTEGSNAMRKVFEGAEANVNIGSPITATDADNDTLTYTLSGTDAGSFNINSATGQLTTKAGVELDYETKSTYTVTVTVSDAQGNIDIISVTINIQDVNETVANNPPIFSDGSSTIRSITENAETNINIGSPITATDPDSGDSLTYSLSGTDAASFDIDSETGQLTTKAALDFETKNTYTVIITVSDGTLTDTITVTINITDIDETIPNRVPVFTDGSSTTRAIAETTTAGTDIGTAVVATDADGDTLTYTLGGTDAASFDIDTTTGQLKTKATLNFDTKNSYTVDVSVSDGKGGSASITVSINVTEEVEEQLSETETEIEDTTPISESSVQGQVSFSELMFTSRGGVHSLAQWMELYNNSKTNVVHLKEWQLTIEARDANGKHRHVVVSLEDLSIPPNRTALIVTWDARRKSVGFPENRVYNFFNLHFDEFEQNQHRNMVLGQVGFFLKLTDPMGVVIDVIGNLDGDPTTKDEPTWEIPSGTTERGTRTSLMRRYEKDTLVPIDGTDLNSWRRSADFKLLVTRYWGNISDIGNPGYRGTGTLPVTLSLFRAEHTNAGVVLKWTTESEVDNAGFYIYRSTTKDGEFKVINPTIIQGAGTTGERNEYTWTDTTAKLNTVYYYRIEDVSHTGVREQLATVQLQGLVSAADKLTTSWGDLKMSQ